MKRVNRELQQAKYYLGIDWGLNKTGLAMADDELKIATVLGEVPTENLIEKIKELQTEYGSLQIVFGNLNQAEQFIGEKNDAVQEQKNELLAEIKKMGVEVVLAEEMLSTKMAQQNLLESGKKMVSKKDNGESAKIILQGWLDGFSS